MVRKTVASVLLAVGMTVTAVALPAGAATGKVSSTDKGGATATCAMCWPQWRY